MRKKTIVALMYDFDHTLSPKDMQEYSFIPSVNMTAGEFWGKCDDMSVKYEMDGILSYMYTMIKEAKKNGIKITRELLNSQAKDVLLYPGVDSWFDRINRYGDEVGVEVEHYVLSSGLEEIIEATSIADKFKKIYACRFCYDENGEAIWPAMAVNYTSKTQFIYRINKGVLDVTDDDGLNNSMKDEDKRIPIANMIYIGDGITDVPCMKLVKGSGGHSIAVYEKNRENADNMIQHGRVDFIHPCDYSEGSAIETTVKTIINLCKAREDAEEIHNNHVKEANNG